MRFVTIAILICLGWVAQGQCVQQAPFVESFDTNATPSCWGNFSQGYGPTVQWQFSNINTSPYPPWFGYFFTEHTGNGGFYAFTWFQFNIDYTLELPEVDISSVSQPVLSFYVNHPALAPHAPKEQLSIEFKNDSVWQVVEIISTYSYNWQYIEVDVPAWAGDTVAARLVAYNEKSINQALLVDDFFVGEKPNCTGVDSLYVHSVTTNDAIVKWMGDTGTYQVGFGPFYVAHANTTKQITSNDSLIIAGLMPATAYECYVRKICGVDTGQWVGPKHFQTACVANLEMPYLQDFDVINPEDSSTNAICWSTQSTGVTKWLPNRFTTYSGMTGPYGDGSPFRSGVYIYTEVTGGSAGDTAYLISPKIYVAPNDSAFLKFAYHMYGMGMGSLQLDVFDGTQWHDSLFAVAGQQHATEAEPYNKVVLPLHSFVNDSVVLRFRSIRGSTNFGDMALDNVQIMDSCVYGFPNAHINESYDSLTANGFYIGFTSFASNNNQCTWYFGDGASDTGNYVVHAYQTNGTFTAWQVVQNQCGRVDSASVIIQIAGIGIDENKIGNVEVYPNPAQDGQDIIVELPNATRAAATLYNAVGQVVLQTEILFNNGVGVFSPLEGAKGRSAGIYTLHLQTPNDETYIEKIVLY